MFLVVIIFRLRRDYFIFDISHFAIFLLCLYFINKILSILYGNYYDYQIFRVRKLAGV